MIATRNYGRTLLATVLMAAACAVAITSATRTSSGAGPVSSQYSQEERLFIPAYAKTTTQAALGTHGVVMMTGIGSGAAYNHFTWTSTLATLPYPSRLSLNLVSAGAQVLECTSARIYGNDQFGGWIDYKFAATSTLALNETAQITPKAFSRVTQVVISGCTNEIITGTVPAIGPTDYVMLKTTKYIGTGRQIRNEANIIAVCTVAGGNNFCAAAADTQKVGETLGFRYFPVDALSSTIDVETGQKQNNWGTPVAESPLLIIYRGSTY